MTNQPVICGVAEDDCPYVKKLKEILQEKKEPGYCEDSCEENLPVTCQSLENFIKEFGLVPVVELDIPILPLPPPKVIFVPVKDTKSSKDIPLTKVRSRELRAGRLYRGCECEKRYGLQDTCPRSECLGSPACLTQPPSCGPSQFSDAKHLIKKMKPNWRAMMFTGEQKFSVRL